jgi:hypothetical protein
MPLAILRTNKQVETTWKIHRIHWEKNRFIFDLMYKRKVMSKDLVSYLYTSSVRLCANRISFWRKKGGQDGEKRRVGGGDAPCSFLLPPDVLFPLVLISFLPLLLLI